MENKIFLNLLIFLLTCGIFLGFFPLEVAALANPAATYCEEMGYEHKIKEGPEGGEQGVCVFPDGASCEAWAFYRGGCGKEYRKELPCKKAGEEVQVSKCCPGLTELLPASVYDKDCEVKVVGRPSICSDCGNGDCESWENKCNCPKDCKKEKVSEEVVAGRARRAGVGEIKKIELVGASSLEEEMLYIVEGSRRAKLFFIFPMEMKMKVKINAQNGKVVSVGSPWWSFLIF